MRSWTLPLFFLLPACTEAPESADAAFVPERADAAVAALQPLLTPEAVAPLALSALVELTTPFAVLGWFDRVLRDLGTSRGEGCPHIQPSPTDPLIRQSNWTGSCVGPTYSVSGGWLYSAREERVDDDIEHSALMLLSFSGSTAEGGSVDGGGWANLEWTVGLDATTFSVEQQGDFVDAASAPPWPGGVRGDLSATGQLVDGVLSATLEGTLATSAADVAIEEGVVSASGFVGRIRLRDPSTVWWVIDVGEDGCGAVSVHAVNVTTACLGADFGAAITAAWVRDLAALP